MDVHHPTRHRIPLGDTTISQNNCSSPPINTHKNKTPKAVSKKQQYVAASFRQHEQENVPKLSRYSALEAYKSSPQPNDQDSRPLACPLDETPDRRHLQVPPSPLLQEHISNAPTPTRRRHNPIKEHIGPWELGRTLGQGNSGSVRLAKHIETGALAAVKIMSKRPEVHYDEDTNSHILEMASSLRYRLQMEVVIMRLISHPNVVSLLDVWENRAQLFMVLEFVEGGELFETIVRHGRFNEIEAMRYFRQLLSAVEYCHSCNICHRDLKPENILIDIQGNIKIADFGLATLQCKGTLLTEHCGSPHYAAPEIISAKDYDGMKADIWSCGVILYTLLSGRLPFDDEDVRKVLDKVKSGRFRMLDFSPEAKDLLYRMMEVNPDKRIMMSEIWEHQLLKRHTPKDWKTGLELSRVPTPLKPEEICAPIRSKDDIEPEIMRHLLTLWHAKSSKEIVEQLMNPEPNQEKVVYYLLMRYHESQLENYPGVIPPNESPGNNSLVSTSRGHDMTELFKRPCTCNRKIVNRHQNQAEINAEAEYHRGTTTVHDLSPSSVLAVDGRCKCKVTNSSNIRGKKTNSVLPNPVRYAQKPLQRHRKYNSRSSITSSRSNATFKKGTIRTSSSQKRGVSFQHFAIPKGNTNLKTGLAVRNQADNSWSDISMQLTDYEPEVETAASKPGHKSLPKMVMPKLRRGGGIQPPVDKNPTESIRKRPNHKFGVEAQDSGTGTHYVNGERIRQAREELKYSMQEDFSPICSSSFHSTLCSSSAGQHGRSSLSPSLNVANTRGSHCNPQLYTTPAKALPRIESNTRSAQKQLTYPPPLLGTKGQQDSIAFPLNFITPHADNAFSSILEQREILRSSNSHVSNQHRKVSQSEYPPTKTVYQDPDMFEEVNDEDRFADADSLYRDIDTSSIEDQGYITTSGATKLTSNNYARLNIRSTANLGGTVSHHSNTQPQRTTDVPEEIGIALIVKDSPPNPHRGSSRFQDLSLTATSSWQSYVAPMKIKRKRSLFEKLTGKKAKEKLSDCETTDQHEPKSAVEHARLFEGRSQKGASVKNTLPGWKSLDARKLFHSEDKIAPQTKTINSLQNLTTCPQDSRRPGELQGCDEYHRIASQQNWFRRFFNVKPTTCIVCFDVPAPQVRKEVLKLWKEWQKYGLVIVQDSRKGLCIRARIDRNNSLNTNEVAFVAEIRSCTTWKKRGLSVARFTQEKGAASSFNRVVKEMVAAFTEKGLVTKDLTKKSRMEKTFN